MRIREPGYAHPFRRGLFAAACALPLCVAAADRVAAQSAPDTENGRYTIAPVAGDFLRLDTRTGAVSTCGNNGGGWVCRLVPDERAALDSEIGKLQAENRKLKDQLSQRDSATSAKPDKKSSEALPDSKFEFQLPADHQKLMALIDRMWDRLVEMANSVQKRLSEKI